MRVLARDTPPTNILPLHTYKRKPYNRFFLFFNNFYCFQAVEEEEKLCVDLIKGHPVIDSWGTLGFQSNLGIPAAGLYIHRCSLSLTIINIYRHSFMCVHACMHSLSCSPSLSSLSSLSHTHPLGVNPNAVHTADLCLNPKT